MRDKIYVEVCDIPQNGVSCCAVDSILLFFGPDYACAEGITDYFTVNEEGLWLQMLQTWDIISTCTIRITKWWRW